MGTAPDRDRGPSAAEEWTQCEVNRVLFTDPVLRHPLSLHRGKASRAGRPVLHEASFRVQPLSFHSGRRGTALTPLWRGPLRGGGGLTPLMADNNGPSPPAGRCYYFRLPVSRVEPNGRLTE